MSNAILMHTPPLRAHNEGMTQSAVEFVGSSRIHISLTTQRLGVAKAFYEVLFGQAPTKVRPGYVKFEPAEPSVNLTLNESVGTASGAPAASHFGIQVKSTEAVAAARARLESVGLSTTVEESTACCYAVQDKVWVCDPDGNRWEIFVVTQADVAQAPSEAGACCAPSPAPSAPPASASCCEPGAGASSCC
jgi:predicted enzyme related to lactoylglutathione lyase